MRTTLGVIEVRRSEARRSEDRDSLFVRAVAPLGEASLPVYWSPAAISENAIPPDACQVGTVSVGLDIVWDLPAFEGEGFVTIWSAAQQKALVSFAVRDLP
jgi:hypothetical protein